MPHNNNSIDVGRLALIALTLAAITLSGPVEAAGGGGVPQGASTMGDSAGSAYNRGLKSRDKAWVLMEQLEKAGPSDRSKLEGKIQKEFAKAIRAYRSALKVNPQMYQAHSSLGYALRKTGEFEAALVAYDQALAIRPAYAEAIEYRAEAYLGLNRLDKAKDAYMHLFRADRKRADELMVAMSEWIEEHQMQPKPLESSLVAEFTEWVESRGGLARQTASLSGAPGSSWD